MRLSLSAPVREAIWLRAFSTASWARWPRSWRECGFPADRRDRGAFRDAVHIIGEVSGAPTPALPRRRDDLSAGPHSLPEKSAIDTLRR